MKSLLLPFLFILSLTISAQDSTRFLIDFGPDNIEQGNAIIGPDSTFGNYWNNLINPRPEVVALVLKTTRDENSLVTMQVTERFRSGGRDRDGLLAPDSSKLGNLGVPFATQDYFEGFANSTGSVVRFSGLTIGSSYRFRILGTRSFEDTQVTRYRVKGINESAGEVTTSGSEIGDSSYQGNLDQVFVSEPVFPAPGGVIDLQLLVPTGTFSYLNALEITELPNQEFCSERNDDRVVFLGSSVARGQGAPNDRGYAFQYIQRQEMREGTDFDFVNRSVGGDNTVRVLDRIARDLFSDCPEYVFLGLSLANEGIERRGQAAFDQFQTNLMDIIARTQGQGITPIIVSNYPRASYEAGDYAFIQRMNLWITGLDIPSVNVLGPVDDGTGRWAAGVQDDPGHPNLAGHTEMSYAFVPSLLDALEAGKAAPEFVTNTALYGGSASGQSALSFTPENTVHSFAMRLDFQVTGPGEIVRLDSGNGQEIVISAREDATGVLQVVRDNDQPLNTSVQPDDGQWHSLIINHRYAISTTEYYLDTFPALTVREPAFPDPTVSFNTDGAPETALYRNFLFYRANLSELEVEALARDSMLTSSLDMYAPLDQLNGLLLGDPLVNLARSTARLNGAISTDVEEVFLPGNSFALAPNPVGDRLIINNIDQLNVRSISLHDLSGRTINKKDGFTSQIDTKNLVAGSYLLRIIAEEGVWTGKIVKQ